MQKQQQQQQQQTFMNVGPALSKLLIRTPYHHRVPLRSAHLPDNLWPRQTHGKESITGANITTSVMNRYPVAIGSMM